FAWVAVKSGLARLPTGVTFAQIYGAAILCGIGFTMSLFIGMLAFENAAAADIVVTDKYGVIAGTLLSALMGSLVLTWVLPRNADPSLS
ncbi:MAG: Na+/H+ antiporter NhaA, partial [Steroidobacteraceae bacterium]